MGCDRRRGRADKKNHATEVSQSQIPARNKSHKHSNNNNTRQQQETTDDRGCSYSVGRKTKEDVRKKTIWMKMKK